MTNSLHALLFRIIGQLCIFSSGILVRCPSTSTAIHVNLGKIIASSNNKRGAAPVFFLSFFFFSFWTFACLLLLRLIVRCLLLLLRSFAQSFLSPLVVAFCAFQFSVVIINSRVESVLLLSVVTLPHSLTPSLVTCDPTIPPPLFTLHCIL